MSDSPESADDDQEEGLYLRTDFLERVAHELRGPAGVTLGALDELELALAEQPSPRVIALLSMARRGARRVLRTAERLSRTAQLEAGSASVAAFPVDVRGVVSRATMDASDTEGRSSVEVITDLPADPCMAAADSTWLGVAIGELVGQAIRSAARSVRVVVRREENLISVSVSDDRVGHREATLKRFSRNASRRGTGLDMPLVHDIARMHGYDVEYIESESTNPGITTRLRLDATK